MKSLFFTVAMLLTASVAFSHALWIEATSSVKPGQAVQVNVFFGEYADNKPDSAARWFSNLKSFKLVLTAPDGKTQILPTKADVFSYTAQFVPQKDGVYTLSIVHHVADTYEKAKIEYYAFTDVSIGAVKNASVIPKDALLSFKVSENQSYSVKYKQKAFAQKKIQVIDPDFKKTEITTGTKGEIDFKPSQKGAYFLEAFEEEKASGQLKGKPYQKIWHLATYHTKVY